MIHRNHIKTPNNHIFVHVLVGFLVILCLKRQINGFSSKITIKQCFYVIKNLCDLLNIFNLNINQLVINIICGGKIGSDYKKVVSDA